MNLFLRKILLLFFCFLLLVEANAQVNISQEIYPAQINRDQYATLKIIIENSNNVQQVMPPSLKNFIVISGPNQESGMSSVNGQVKQFSALSFILKPKQPGKISIDAATVNIGGRSYKTNKTELLVKNATSANAPGNRLSASPFPNIDPFAIAKPSADFNDYVLHKGENVPEKVSKSMQLRLETDKTSCYVGEPVVASYKLYTRLKSESKLTENPSFNGFSVIDLTKADITGYTKQKLNGREYNVYIIRKAQLYPLQAGNIDLESAELENSIEFIKEDYIKKRGNDVYGIFDDFAGASVAPEGVVNETVSLRSKPVSILVKPLPEVNKPASFTGAVGIFSIEAVLQKPAFPANEAGKLIVKINGAGNLQLLTAPVLQWPAGIDPFDPKVSEDLDKNSVPVSGSKTFEYDFSVDKEGNYILPAINFSYFDPATATYKAIATKEIPFMVTKATGPVNYASVPLSNKEEVSGINKIFKNRWWIIEFIAIVMVIGLIVWIRKDKKATEEVNKLAALKKAEEEKVSSIIDVSTINQQNPLTKTEACLYRDDCSEFYSLLNTELKSFLAQKFFVNAAEINTRNIVAVMDKNNINNDTVLQLQQLLQEVEWQLYTPFERNEKIHALYADAQDIIQLINTYNIKPL